MIRRFLIILIILFYSCGKQQKQSSQNKVRIISLSPHITEIIYALGMDSSLMAVTDFCNYPSQAKKKESIGGLFNPNIEKIVSLRPTHLFGVLSNADLNQELSKFGLQILMLPNETLQDIQNIIKVISDTLNVERKGKKFNDSIQEDLSKLKNENPTFQKKKVMLVIGRERGSVRNMTVAGPNTYLNEIWELVGGQNIFDDLPNKYAQVNLEEIIKRNPDVIIEFNMDREGGIKRADSSKEWDILKNVKAVSNKNIFEIGGNYSLIPGPRVVLLAKDFYSILTTLNKE